MAEHIEENQKHLIVADKNPISSVLQKKNTLWCKKLPAEGE